MRIAGATAPVEALGGRMTAQLADDRVPRRLELALPPGVLVLTTETSDEMKSAFRTAGASGWMSKPYDQDRMTAALSKFMPGGA